MRSKKRLVKSETRHQLFHLDVKMNDNSSIFDFCLFIGFIKYYLFALKFAIAGKCSGSCFTACPIQHHENVKSCVHLDHQIRLCLNLEWVANNFYDPFASSWLITATSSFENFLSGIIFQ